MVTMLQKMKEVGQPLATFTIQPILHEMFKSLAFDVICDTNPGGVKVAWKWTHQFMKRYMNWTFKANTTIFSKLPTNW